MLYDKRWDVDEVGQVLLSAADYMDQHGWCQYLSRNGDGNVCIQGAIEAMQRIDASQQNISFQALCRLNEHLKRTEPSFAMSAPSEWNDNRCRSKEQAVAALREAAFVKETCPCP
jgi:hypothetical protein